MKVENLMNGRFYHIYNRGNNRRDLYGEAADYEHFLSLYEKYITPVAETFAWVLMPNHFHLLVRIKKNIVYRYSIPGHQTKNANVKNKDAEWCKEHKWETIDTSDSSVTAQLKQPVPHKHFAHLFNAYARYYNIRTGGTGNLFERPFKRKEADTMNYLRTLILYIHKNPVHHGFCNHPLEYSWSGYLSCISDKQANKNREAIIQLFGNKDNFETEHNQESDFTEIEKWLNLGTIDYVTKIPINDSILENTNDNDE